jgi:hypothetical protein
MRTANNVDNKHISQEIPLDVESDEQHDCPARRDQQLQRNFQVEENLEQQLQHQQISVTGP